ncbi:hypothetical protein JHK87_041456 [Glycine soja]|nr:hypothetical protein JHK87_041456 [Glycine soja]
MAPFHVGLRATNHLFCYARGISFLLMITFVNPLSFHYQGFEYDDARIEGDATLAHSEIQLTSATKYQSNAYSVGRVTTWLLKLKMKTRGKEDDLDLIMDSDFERGTGPKRFSYNELVRTTNNFANELKLGEGGFGGVYKGFIRE